jgi:hypothetical protein
VRAVGCGQDNPGIADPSEQPLTPTPPRSSRRGALARASEWIVPAENPGGVVYGVIVIGALLAAESGRHETYLDTLASAVIAAALFWLAHSYASVLGRRLTVKERLTPAALRRALAHDWALIRGAAIPLFVLLAWWLAGAAQATAVTAALWSAAVSLTALELIAGVRAHASARELTLEAVVGLTMGLGIIALKVLLH